MSASSPDPSEKSSSLCGKLATHSTDTYIVLCLHCLHYFRSLTELLRHRLLNHNILDTVPPGETLPRVSKDGSWLVAGGDSEPQYPSLTNPTPFPPGHPIRQPASAGIPTPSPPPQGPIQAPQFRSLGPHHQMQNPQYFTYNPIPPQTRPIPPFPQAQYRGPQNPYTPPPQGMTSQTSPVAPPVLQNRPPQASQGGTTSFSASAREFVPSRMVLGEQGKRSD